MSGYLLFTLCFHLIDPNRDCITSQRSYDDGSRRYNSEEERTVTLIEGILTFLVQFLGFVWICDIYSEHIYRITFEQIKHLSKQTQNLLLRHSLFHYCLTSMLFCISILISFTQWDPSWYLTATNIYKMPDKWLDAKIDKMSLNNITILTTKMH